MQSIVYLNYHKQQKSSGRKVLQFLQIFDETQKISNESFEQWLSLALSIQTRKDPWKFFVHLNEIQKLFSRLTFVAYGSIMCQAKAPSWLSVSLIFCELQLLFPSCVFC